MAAVVQAQMHVSRHVVDQLMLLPTNPTRGWSTLASAVLALQAIAGRRLMPVAAAP